MYSTSTKGLRTRTLLQYTVFISITIEHQLLEMSLCMRMPRDRGHLVIHIKMDWWVMKTPQNYVLEVSAFLAIYRVFRLNDWLRFSYCTLHECFHYPTRTWARTIAQTLINRLKALVFAKYILIIALEGNCISKMILIFLIVYCT